MRTFVAHTERSQQTEVRPHPEILASLAILVSLAPGGADVTAVDVGFVLRFALALVLLDALVGKMREPGAFLSHVADYGIVPMRASQAVGVAVLAAEFTGGLLLILGFRAGLYISVALFTAFSSGLSVSLIRGVKAPCNCFGANQHERISAVALGRALILLTISSAALLQAPWHAPLPASGHVIPALSLAVGVALLVRLSGSMSEVLSYYRTPAVLVPSPTRRVSLKHQPLDVSLHASATHRESLSREGPKRNGGTM